MNDLIHTLQDEDRLVRRRTIDALGNLRDAHAVPALIAALGDSDIDNRYHAADALGNLGDARAIEALSKSLKEGNHSLSSSAAQALRKLGNGDLVDKWFREKELEENRRKMIRGLCSNLSPENSDSLLEQFTNDPDPDIRCMIADAFRRMPDPRAIDPFLCALKDSYLDQSVRRSIILALGKLSLTPGGSESLPAAMAHILARLNDAEDDNHRSDIILELREMREVRAVGPLVLWLGYPFEKVRCRAAEALGEIGGPEAVAGLIKALQSSAGQLRLIIVEALEKIGDEHGLRAAASAFKIGQDRLKVERDNFHDISSLMWDPGQFVHHMMYGRGKRILSDPMVNQLTNADRIYIYWAVGRFGLLAGAQPQECLAYFQKGMELSPQDSTNIVRDHFFLSYALAILNHDYERARALRLQVFERRSPFNHAPGNSYASDFRLLLHHIIRGTKIPIAVLEFV